MIIDAGYMNGKGEYIEDLMYFSFEPSEKEKKQILDEQNQEEYDKWMEYERQCYEFYGGT